MRCGRTWRTTACHHRRCSSGLRSAGYATSTNSAGRPLPPRLWSRHYETLDPHYKLGAIGEQIKSTKPKNFLPFTGIDTRP